MVSLLYVCTIGCALLAGVLVAVKGERRVAYVCLVCAMASVRMAVAVEHVEIENSSYEISKPFVVDSVAIESSKRNDAYVTFVALDEETGATLFVRGRSENDVGRGDSVRVVGSLIPDVFHRGDRVMYQFRASRIDILWRAPISWDETVRRWFVANISRVVPEPEASLVAGMAIGQEGNLSKAVLQTYRDTGTAHILVASGYNVSIVASVALAVFGSVSFVGGIVVAFCAVVAYAIVAGAGASVVRAAVMASVVLAAKLLGRPHAALRALIYACVLMYLYDPYIIFDVGFQLSVGATAGIMLLPHSIEGWCMWVPETFGFRESLVTTLAATLGVFPVVLVTFGTVSLVSPIVNMLIAPLVPYIMATGIVAGIVGGIVPFVSYLPGWCAYGCAWILNECVRIAAGVPFASIKISSTLVWLVVGLYAVVLCGLILQDKRR